MLDIKRIINERDEVEEGLLKRMDPDDLDLDAIIAGYEKRLELQKKYDELKAQQNSANNEMAQLEKGSEEFKTKVSQLKDLSEKAKEVEDKLRDVDTDLTARIEVLPNVPDKDVVAGGKEANEVIKTYGEKPKFEFKIKDHVEIVTEHNLVDFERASKIGGAQMSMYVGDGALLEWGMLQFFISEHLNDGYEMVLPPHLISEQSAYTAGQLPKFREDVFWTEDGHCLLPTSESALANVYRDDVIEETELPRKFFAYTPCYRREAGSYRANERGLMRMHQFNKVEMFQYTTPETSAEAFDELIGKACKLVEKLGLHYNLVKLAAGDCSAGMARTYDVEVYLPGLDRYIEVSSCSNAKDYQSRRGNMRYKPADGSKPRYMHTLNASGLATSRLFVAIVETYQNEDGTVTVPEVLRPFVGKDKIG